MDTAMVAVGLGVFLTLALSVRADYNLVVLHTNDVHARVGETDSYSNLCDEDDIAENKCYAGVARRLTEIKEVRAAHDNVLLLDGGDQFQGTIWFTYYRGVEAANFMNRLGYDALALGNHEFDNGIPGLVDFLHNASFPILSANMDVSNEPLLKDEVRPSVVKTVGGQKIAIIGYTVRELGEFVDPTSIASLVMKDEVEEIRKEAKRLMSENPDLNKIIALGHAGHQMDKKIAKEVEEVDIVVGGHSNTFLYNGDAPSREVPFDHYPVVVTKASGAKALVVMDYAFGKYLGFLDVVFDDSGAVKSWSGNPILLDSTIPQDPGLLAEVRKWEGPLKDYTKKEIGMSNVHLEGDASILRKRESNLGNLLTDAMLFSILRNPDEGSWSRSGLAFWSGGGLRAPIRQGIVTLGDILTALPFSNELYMLDVNGSLLLQIFEHSISKIEDDDPSGRFLQVSGFRVTYDITKSVNNRVKELLVRCSECTVPRYDPVDPEAVYTVVTSHFMYIGGDGFTMIKEGVLRLNNIGTIAADVLAEYIEIHSPIVHGLERRITILDEPQTPVTEGPCTGVGSRPAWSPLLVLYLIYIGCSML